MISICSTTLDKIKHYEDIFINSILNHTEIVSEVVLANNDLNPTYHKEWFERNIKFIEVGSQENLGTCLGDEHALGLHKAIDNAKNDLVFLCDPDIFFLSSVDKLYFELMEKYDLQTIGCSHHAATEIAQTFFPWHGNILLNKKLLPRRNFLAEENRVPGKFLLAGLGVSKKELYPNPDGNFDTSSGLWFWAYQNNWKWLAFQTDNVHLYTTRYYRSKNIKINERLRNQNLLYHAVSGSIKDENWMPFKETYDKNTI